MNDKQESVAATKKSTTSKKESTIATKLVTAIEAALGPKSAKSLRTQQTSSSFSGPVSTQACGYGGYRPEWLQVLHNSKCFLVCLCLCSITQGLVMNGLIPVSVTTLQKRFELTSTQIGILTSIYDGTVILSLLPVSHFGGKGHKPRWMAYGLLIMGVGSFVFASPTFLLDTFQVNATEEVCSSVQKLDKPNECDKQGLLKLSKVHGFYYVFIFAQILHGIGATPIYTLGITFLDESIPQAASPVYLGFFYALSILGPVIGFILGGALLGIEGDIGKTDESKTTVQQDDPSWYGAWWIGFLISGSMAVAFSLPIFAFARRLPEAKANRLLDINQAHGGGKQPHISRKLSDFPRAICQLLKNLPYVLIVAAKCAESFLLAGFITFLPKVVENFFSVTASSSSLLTGIIFIPGGLAGTVAGGYIVRKCNLRCSSMMVMALICQIIAGCFGLCLLLHCADSRFVGVNESPLNLTEFVPGDVFDSCNAKCFCADHYKPVCHLNSSLVYYSPCHAGCTVAETDLKSVDDDKLKEWSDCTCLKVTNDTEQLKVTEDVEKLNLTTTYETETLKVTKYTTELKTTKYTMELKTTGTTETLKATKDINQWHGGNVVSGYCPVKCTVLGLFMLVSGLQVLMTCLAGMPIQQIELRCVPFKQRTLALSLSWIFVRLFGTIPGAIALGYAVDYSCSLWKKECGKQVSCLRYNNSDLANRVLFIVIGLKSLMCIFIFLAWIAYRPSEEGEDIVAKYTGKTDDKIADKIADETKSATKKE